MKKTEYFKCFSVPLHRFLRVNGVKPLSKGVHEETQKTFWVYEMNDRLAELLTVWTANKPSNK